MSAETHSLRLPDHLPTLEGDPLVTLRPFRTDDVDLVRSVARDPLIPLITTVPTSGSREDALAYLERQHERLPQGRGYSFAIADARTDGAVGQIGLWTSALGEGRTSTGYWISPAFRRRGYVRAALGVLTGWALSMPEVHRVQLYVEPWNEGSWRAAEACGYRREGLLRSWQQVGDERKDMYLYARVSEGDADAAGSAGRSARNGS